MEEEKEIIRYVAGVPLRKNGLYLVTFVIVDHEYRLVEKMRSMILESDLGKYAYFSSHSERPPSDRQLELRGVGAALLFDVFNLKEYFQLEVNYDEDFPIYTNPKPRQGEASFIRFEYLKQYQQPDEQGQV